MENEIKKNQSEWPEQKQPPEKSTRDTIPLHTTEKADARNQDGHDHFCYRGGKTKIECTGDCKKAIRLAFVDIIGRLIISVLIVVGSVYSAYTAKKMFGNEISTKLKKANIEIQNKIKQTEPVKK